MDGLINLPKGKWWSANDKEPGVKQDMRDVETAILQSFGLLGPPTIEFVDVTSIRVPATPDDIAPVMMIGFPSQLHPGMFVSAGLTDGRYRENSDEVTLDFDLAGALWGTEKASQHYIIYGVAGNASASFTLKGMPYMRVGSQDGQVISLGTLANPALGIGYGFVGDEMAGGAIYVLTGDSRGRVRAITANNNNNTNGGTITYGGTGLVLAQGDWFVVLPPGTNFRWFGDVFNKGDNNIRDFLKAGSIVAWREAVSGSLGDPSHNAEDISICSPLARRIMATLIYNGGADSGWIGPQGYGAHYGGLGTNAVGYVPIDYCKYSVVSDSLNVLQYAFPHGCGY